jgi:hypothetical protein
MLLLLDLRLGGGRGGGGEVRPVLLAEVDNFRDKDVPPERVAKGALDPAYKMP